MALETLANQILALVNWGITIIVLMLIWEVIQFFRGGADAEPLLKAGGGMDKFWKGVKARVPGTAMRARRVQKKELNEYILEEKEEKYLDLLKGKALEILSDLEAVASRGYFSQSEKTNIVGKVKEFGEQLNQVTRNFRNLNKRTSRAESGLDNLFDYLKKKDIKVPAEVKDLEEHILVLHRQTGEEIAAVQGVYTKIVNSDAMKKLDSLTPAMFAGAAYKIGTGSVPFNLVQLYALIKGFKNQRFLLEDAYKKQAEAKKEMQGIISETRGLYE